MADKTGTIIKCDVAIVGGGHAGGTMAALLGNAGVDTVCIDLDDPAAALTARYDGRTTAISYGSRNVIAATGIWDSLLPFACPISEIKIMESGSPVLLDFQAADVGAEAFGWIIENREIRRALFERLAALECVRHLAPVRATNFEVTTDHADVHLADGRIVRASLVIGADGRKSPMRAWMGIGTRGHDYGQQAIVCIVTHEYPHGNRAIEDFRGEGPFAVLPMLNDDKGRYRSAVVWTEHGGRQSAMHWDDAAFAAALSERFPDSYGKVEVAGPRASYPLNLVHAHDYIGPRMALVADAAHGIHPIAGQGLNLGLRDIAALADLILAAQREGRDYGSADQLEAYQTARRLDNMVMAGATDTLNALFSNSMPGLRALRKIGLRMVNRAAPVRRFFMRQAMGSAGILPALVREGRFSGQ